MTVRWGHCISNSFNVTSGVHQDIILSPQLFNVYIDGLLGGKHINHLL